LRLLTLYLRKVDIISRFSNQKSIPYIDRKDLVESSRLSREGVETWAGRIQLLESLRRPLSSTSTSSISAVSSRLLCPQSGPRVDRGKVPN